MKLLLGTRNKGKYAEMKTALADLPLTLVSPDAFPLLQDPEETGETYTENAVLKALFYADAAKLPTIADDSGIVVDALAGELGVKTRRWGAGPGATDQEWIAFFLKRMEQEEIRTARFISTIAFVDKHHDIFLFTGTCEGTIEREQQGNYLPGLPLRSCFRPTGARCVLSLMTLEEEKHVNHRQKSLQQLKDHLENNVIRAG